MLQREVSDLQVSAVLGLPPGSLLSRGPAYGPGYIWVCQGYESYTCFSCIRGHDQQF